MIKTTNIYGPDLDGFVKVNNNTDVESKTSGGTTFNAPLTCIDFSSENTLRTGLGLSSDVANGSINLLANCALAVFNTSYTNADFNNTDVYNNTSASYDFSTTK